MLNTNTNTNYKDILSSTLTPKSYKHRDSQNNPLNPKNLPIKPLFINIPKATSGY